MWYISSSQKSFTHGKQQSTVQIKLPDCAPGSYISCMYEKSWYIANVIESSEENQDFWVTFMLSQL